MKKEAKIRKMTGRRGKKRVKEMQKNKKLKWKQGRNKK
jgi:hypothetical protein